MLVSKHRKRNTQVADLLHEAMVTLIYFIVNVQMPKIHAARKSDDDEEW